MKAIIFISGRINEDETLKDVISQFKRFENPTEVEVNIKSGGGSESEGNAAYDYLRAIDESGIPVTTKAEKAYSIAAKIFAAGSTRIVEDKPDVLGVHFARATTKGTLTAEQAEELSDLLYEKKKEFTVFYSEHLNIDEGTVETLLDNETIMSGQEAVDMGFATEVEKVAELVAELYIDKTNKSTMTQKKDKKGFFKQFLADFEAWYKEENEGEAVAELTLQDSNGTDIVFPDLESDATPKVGDKGEIDGANPEDNKEYTMPSLEDSIVIFVDGKITEIKPKEEEAETDAEVEARFTEGKAKVELRAETEGLEISTWSMRLVNDSFAVGDVVKYYDWEDNECVVSASEIKVPNIGTIVTDATGTIVMIKEADAPEQVLDNTETEASFEDVLEKMTGKVTKKVKEEVTAEMTADFEAKIADKDKEIKALKAKIGGKEFEAEIKEGIPAGKAKEKGASRFLTAANNL